MPERRRPVDLGRRPRRHAAPALPVWWHPAAAVQL